MLFASCFYAAGAVTAYGEADNLKDDSNDSDNIPLAELSRQQETITAGQYAAVVYGNRWYPVCITGVDGDNLLISYMAPVRGKWKWGLSDLGTVHKEGVLAFIKEPKQVGHLYTLHPDDLKIVTGKFSSI